MQTRVAGREGQHGREYDAYRGSAAYYDTIADIEVTPGMASPTREDKDCPLWDDRPAGGSGS